MMNFFRRKDAIKQVSESEETSDAVQHDEAKPVEVSPEESETPDVCEDNRAESDPELIVEREEADDPESILGSEAMQEPEPIVEGDEEQDPEPIDESDETGDPLLAEDLFDDEPDAHEIDIAADAAELEVAADADELNTASVTDDEPYVDAEESDDKGPPNPFEARLARLRQQLQEAPKRLSDAPAQFEAEPVPKPEPEPDMPEPDWAFETEPKPEMPVEKVALGLPREPTPTVPPKDEALSFIADAEAELPPIPIVSEPPIGLTGRRAGRVKTRLLGFERGASSTMDPLGAATKAESSGRFPVGWIVVVKGPGRGASFSLYNGLSQIGRGSDQTVCLDFGDTSISRENHAVVAYDSEQKKHFLGHGGKANIVRLNDMPVLSTEELSHGDQIRIGETTLRFVALCGADFDWSMTATDDDFDAAVL